MYREVHEAKEFAQHLHHWTETEAWQSFTHMLRQILSHDMSQLVTHLRPDSQKHLRTNFRIKCSVRPWDEFTQNNINFIDDLRKLEIYKLC